MTESVPEIEVWLFSIKDVPQQVTTEGLSELELQRASRYRIAEKRRQFLLARLICRRVVSSILQVSPEAIDWPASGPAKLKIRGQAAPVSISLSHSGDSLAMAICPREWSVGIDIEETGNLIQVGALSGLALTSAERLILAEVPPDLQGHWMRQVWTGKEAALKSLNVDQPPEASECELRDALTPAGLLPSWISDGDACPVSVIPFFGTPDPASGETLWEVTPVLQSGASVVGVLAIREQNPSVTLSPKIDWLSVRLRSVSSGGSEIGLALGHLGVHFSRLRLREERDSI